MEITMKYVVCWMNILTGLCGMEDQWFYNRTDAEEYIADNAQEGMCYWTAERRLK
jgi:hypothetical protein